MATDTLRIGITCYPSVGGSGVLATALGEELAARGHDVHFIAYERPFRLPSDAPRLHFHPVAINGYALFRFPDYTLPLSVRMAEVTRDHGLDVLHVHYAVPHATAAILARAMLPAAQQPRVVTTLHGTDTTMLGRDADYRPAIHHALSSSDAVTTVSHFLKQETQRIDILLETIARIRPRESFKLLVLAGGESAPFTSEVKRLGLEDRIIVREKINDIEDYLQAADIGVFTSEMESFCLSILEAMCF